MEYLLEFGQWLYANEFPLQDVLDQVEWAVDILLNMQDEESTLKKDGMYDVCCARSVLGPSLSLRSFGCGRNGSGGSSMVDHQTRDQKIRGLRLGRSGGRMFFSRVNFLCYFRSLELCEHIAIRTESCGNTKLLELRAMGTQSCWNFELWEHRADGT